MRLVITTTCEDEVEDVLDLEIPNVMREEVVELADLDTPHGLHEIDLGTAARIAEAVFVDIGELYSVRCWLHL